MDSAVTISTDFDSIKQKQEIDEADIDWLLNDFKDEVRGNISGLTTNVTILVENYDNISEAAVTSATVRNMITMMTQGDLSVITERIDMIEQSATTHQREYQNLYEQTMGFLDPNVDQLIQRVKDISIVVSGNTNDIENIKRQLSGV
jgi:archaellum component FlaC